MHQRVVLRAFQVLLGVTLGLTVVFLSFRGSLKEDVQDSPAAQYFLPAPIQVSEFTLPSTLGYPVSSRDLKGKVLIVFFGYTSCPDVCPLTLTRLTQAFREMGEDGTRVQVLLITVDPARDTVGRMRGYLENFHPSFVGLTGTVEEIRTVADGFGAYFSEPTPGTNYTVDHTARAFVLDRYGRMTLTFPVTATAAEIAQEIETLIEISGG